MSHEVLSFQIGQCGNSIGLQFWQGLSREHGLGPDGQLLGDDLCGIDNKNAFFHEYESGRFVPRCVMLDLEPRVIQSIKNSEYKKLFEQQNMFVGTEGGGAGNNWASGYALAGLHQDTLCDLISREVETTDNMEGFLLSHAISGGTGSGMGSFIMELLTELYPKKILQTYSVFPTSVNLNNNLDRASPYGDVILEPYNSLLTLLRLTYHADSVIVLDNLALHNLTPESRFPNHPSFNNINKIVANVMTASLAPVRYPGQMFNTLTDVVLSLTPVPLLHFLMTGYTPLRSSDYKTHQQIARTSVESVLRNLGRLRHMMVSLHHSPSTPHGYISVFNVIQGRDMNVEPRLVSQMATRFRHQGRYLPWAPGVYQTCVCPRSPYINLPDRVSGLAMANHSSIVSFFKSVLSQFGKLYSRKAYIDQMGKLSGFSDLEEEIDRCRLSCEDLVSQYDSALLPNYPTHYTHLT